MAGFASLSLGDKIRIIIEVGGGPQYNKTMRSAAASTETLGKSARTAGTSQAGLGRATQEAGAQMPVFAKRTFLANQALFTLRRYAFYATLAIAGIFAQGLRMGFKFNSTMEQGMLLMTKFTGSATEAKKIMTDLFRTAVYTPFSFEQIVTATQVLLRFGVAAPLATQTIKNLGDAMAGLPNSGARLSRAALALGHMANIGRLTGRVLMQLQQDQVPMAQALEKVYGLTGDQLRKIGKLGIPASYALAALNKFISTNPKYAKTAYELSLHSLAGLWAAFKDFSSQTAGLITKPLYDSIEKALYGVVKQGGLLDKASKATTIRERLAILTKPLGGGDSMAKGLINLAVIVKDLWKIFIQAWVPALVIAGRVLSSLVPILKIVAFFMDLLAAHTTALKVILVPLATIWLILHGRAMLVWFATRLLTIATFGLFHISAEMFNLQKAQAAFMTIWASRMVIMRVVTLLFTRSLVTNIAALYAWATAQKIVTAEGAAGSSWIFVQTGRLAKLVRALGAAVIATKAFAASLFTEDAALLANPIIALVAAITALTVGLVVLYFKWKAFHDAVNATFMWLWNHPVLLNLIPIFGNLIFLAKIFATSLQPIKDTFYAIRDAAEAAFNAAKWLWSHPKISGKGILDFFNPANLFHASGGYIPTTQVGIVGERGPEAVVLPGGSTVLSHTQVMQSVMNNPLDARSNDNRPIVVQVILDRKVLAEAVAKVYADASSDR